MSFLAKCPKRIEVAGFTSGNGLYTSEVGWFGSHQEFYRQDGGNNCIYRGHFGNNWWIYSCSASGESGGITFEAPYLPSNYQCPTDGKKGDWRYGGTDAMMNGYAKIYYG